MPKKKIEDIKIEDLTSDAPIVIKNLELKKITISDPEGSMVVQGSIIACKHQNQAADGNDLKCLDCNQTLN
jgi:hypothetical protein